MRLSPSLFPVQEQIERARQFLQTMGFKARLDVRNVSISLSYQEAQTYSKIFKSFDKDRDGHINIHDLRKALQEMGEKVSEEELRELIAEVDINKNGNIEEEEFLQVGLFVPCSVLPSFPGPRLFQLHEGKSQVPSLPSPLQLMSALKTGEVANVRLGSIIQQRERVSVDRSGGGL